MNGKVKWFDKLRGYGFVTTEGGEDIFLHITALKDVGILSIDPGAALEFNIRQTQKGKQVADIRRPD